jgi:hypothetical protein
MSLSERRVLVTFDKDFGEMAFRHGKAATCGVIMLRPRLRAPDYLARFMAAVLAQAITWEGNLSVAREGKLRKREKGTLLNISVDWKAWTVLF